MPTVTTLADALRETDEHRWRGMRSQARNYSQATIAIKTLETIIRHRPAAKAKPAKSSITIRGFTFPAEAPARPVLPPRPGDRIAVASVKPEHLKAAVRVWRNAGTQAGTIRAWLNCLPALGVDVKGCRPPLPRKLKWWLNPQQQSAIIAVLTTKPTIANLTLADLIE